MPKPVYVESGPFKIEKVDNDCPEYLKIKFSDGDTRKMAKGGNWPSHLAKALHEKVKQQYDLNEEVYVITSQTTKDWDPKVWLCDTRSVEDQKLHTQIDEIANDEVLWTPVESTDRFMYVEYTYVARQFDDPDLNHFETSLGKEFQASWQSAKHGRCVSEEHDIRRIRIGTDELSKRQGYRVTVFKACENINGWSWMIILQVDEKLKDMKKWPDEDEMIAKAERLISGEKSPEKIEKFLRSLSKKNQPPNP